MKNLPDTKTVNISFSPKGFMNIDFSGGNYEKQQKAKEIEKEFNKALVGTKAFIEALYSQLDVQAVKLLEKLIHNDQFDKNLALRNAVFYKSKSVSKFLIMNDADPDSPNPDGKTAREMARADGYEEIMKIIQNVKTIKIPDENDPEFKNPPTKCVPSSFGAIGSRKEERNI